MKLKERTLIKTLSLMVIIFLCLNINIKGKVKKDIGFTYKYNGDNKKPKINCKLKSETIQDIHNESII